MCDSGVKTTTFRPLLYNLENSSRLAMKHYILSRRNGKVHSLCIKSRRTSMYDLHDKRKNWKEWARRWEVARVALVSATELANNLRHITAQTLIIFLVPIISFVMHACMTMIIKLYYCIIRPFLIVCRSSSP